jgi:hypothetical protein
MNPVIRALTALVLAASLQVAYAQLRPEVGKPLQQASEYLKSGRAKEALAKVREADAVPNKTPAEQLTVDRMRGAAAARAGDTSTAIKSFEATMASGKLNPAEQAQTSEQLAYLYSQAKDWNRTREWAQKAKQLGANGGELDKLLAYVNTQTGDYSAVARDAQAAVEAAEKAGRRPEEGDLLRLADALRRSGNNAGQAAVLEKLVSYYPKQEYWGIVLGRIQSKPGFSPRLTFDVMRLKRETKTLETAEDYVEMTQLALQNGQAAEAKAVIDEGFARGLVGKGAEAERQKRLQALATQKAADAPKDLAKSEAESSGDGNALVRIGMAYVGLGQVDKGIALMQSGIAKGGLKHADEARLHLGIAYLRAGNKAKANETLRSVKGTDGTADLARLWTRV